MKKLTIILLLTSLFGYTQVDYKSLVKNLEEVTIDTDIKEYLKGLPFEESYSDIEFNDERFLLFYDVIIDKVEFKNGWSGKTINITPFNEIEEYEKIKAKLIETYGEPKINVRRHRINHEWDTTDKLITLNINTQEENENEEESQEELKQGAFKEFEELSIYFKQQ